MQPTSLTMAAALTQAVEEINQSRTLEETFDAIVRAARSSIPAFEHISISLRSGRDAIETKAGTDQLVWDLDAAQYGIGEGPCVDAIEHEPVVVVEHARHEQRWPRYMPAAVERGVRSQVGVQLLTNGEHLGGLNLYSTEHDEVDQESVDIACLFATHVAVMLGHVQKEHNLSQALQSRKVIGQAIGILMERYRIDENRAFQFLLRASSTSNVKLRDVAEELVTSSTARYRPQTRARGAVDQVARVSGGALP